MYITIQDYGALYDAVDEKTFNRLAYEACRLMDIQTTGIDGVKKLKVAFPLDEDDAAAVKHCAAKVINLLYQVQEAENSAASGRDYEATEQGMRGRVISSITAGNESISYATSANVATAIDKAVSDMSVRDGMIVNTIRGYLSGVPDANGVNLLYMGAYPRR